MADASQNQFLKKAQEAALWMLERDKNPPVMERCGNALRFTAVGLEFEYRPRGWHYDDNPWREENLGRVQHDEGLVVVAKCPRHGGERRSWNIPTRPLHMTKYIGRLIGCSLCSSKTVVVRLPERLHPRGGVIMASNYCATCAERRFQIPKSSWLPKPPRYTEDEFRGPTRRALAEFRKWAEDVECDDCVTWVYASAGGGCDTHAMARRTYVR